MERVQAMRRILSSAGACVVVLALGGLAVSGRADEAFRPEEGFTSLFNGKDFTGWVYRGSKADLAGKTETPDGRMAVVDGVIVMREKDQSGKGGIKAIDTRQSFAKAFHLKVEFRAGPRADSGVYVRGPQLQVRDYRRRNEQKQLTKFVTDGWNSLDIVVRDDVTTTLVNGKLLGADDRFAMTLRQGEVTATLNGKEIDAKAVQVRHGAMAECRCNGQPLEVMTGLPGKGPIGLQAEAGKFEFRRVRIKELD